MKIVITFFAEVGDILRWVIDTGALLEFLHLVKLNYQQNYRLDTFTENNLSCKN
jgi:hypothetical protein